MLGRKTSQSISERAAGCCCLSLPNSQAIIQHPKELMSIPGRTACPLGNAFLCSYLQLRSLLLVFDRLAIAIDRSGSRAIRQPAIRRRAVRRYSRR